MPSERAATWCSGPPPIGTGPVCVASEGARCAVEFRVICKDLLQVFTAHRQECGFSVCQHIVRPAFPVEHLDLAEPHARLDIAQRNLLSLRCHGSDPHRPTGHSQPGVGRSPAPANHVAGRTAAHICASQDVMTKHRRKCGEPRVRRDGCALLAAEVAHGTHIRKLPNSVRPQRANFAKRMASLL